MTRVPSDALATVTGRNRLINSAFPIEERLRGVATSIADNAYWADRWRYIGEASATCKGNSFSFFARGGAYIQAAGTTDKFGMIQIVESANCIDLRSQPVVLSASIAVSNVRLGNIKMGIAQFTSTADATTGDPISSWGADGVTPTLAANWSWVNTPSNLAVTTSEARVYVNGVVGASMNNLAAVIWNDDKSYTAADTLHVTDVQLEYGSYPTLYERRWKAAEVDACLFYYWKSPDAGLYTMCFGTSTNTVWSPVQFPKPMRQTPTFATWNATSLNIIQINGGNITNAGWSPNVLSNLSGNIVAAGGSLSTALNQAGWIKMGHTSPAGVLADAEI